MTRIDTHSLARMSRRIARWTGTVGTATAVLALVGILAGPDVERSDQRAGASHAGRPADMG